ncbi:preprotein translocase subunit SecE [Erysipelotrichaceae bacterium OH741_COT-311]|nr:preprotein translocase subunit SecE [Erysipelotrichaceae bacterium]MDO5085023.1 preprotein translocase subunit SecE [Erysipelotrichaceae bacterium]RRC90990.1 preprotein translocase subunit SecE [Erysipelotrichaceae bacterium OH741_COT-311]
MLKWFSISGIMKEIGRIRWPKMSELSLNSLEVIIFTAFFGLFFVACEFIITHLLKVTGIGG